jgi:3-oxoacyl-[acyl-carrier protein] reductase
MDTGLEGRVAVVTGAASGIGLATARALELEGCHVVAADLAERSPDYGEHWLPVAVDVSSPDAGDRIAEAARGRWGRLDVLVACAGIYQTTALEALTVEEFDRFQAVNVRGSMLCARSALNEMKQRSWGRIVLMSSMVVNSGGLAAGPAYVTSKAAIVGLTRSLVHSGGPYGVTANCVHPGIIESPMTAVLDRDLMRGAAERTPLKRNGTPQDVAAVIVMLCSEGAGFVTGARIDVNGGAVMS